MAFPEKQQRNKLILSQHLKGMSYREIQKYHNLSSVKSIYRIVARMKNRNAETTTKN